MCILATTGVPIARASAWARVPSRSGQETWTWVGAKSRTSSRTEPGSPIATRYSERPGMPIDGTEAGRPAGADCQAAIRVATWLIRQPEAAMSRSHAFALLIVVSASLAAGPPEPASGGCGGCDRGARRHALQHRPPLPFDGRRIAQASRLADPRRIEIGQQLVIPGSGAPAAPRGAGQGGARRERGPQLPFHGPATRFIRWRAGRGSASAR